MPTMPTTEPSEPVYCGRMGTKPVFAVLARTVINPNSGFAHKKLCTGPTFSTGDCCVYSCQYCSLKLGRASQYVREVVREATAGGHKRSDIVVRRLNALEVAKANLEKLGDMVREPHVVFTSPNVDPAANMTLVHETADIVDVILERTAWEIRVLSKSNLLPKLADLIPDKHRMRVIYGVSTGILDDRLAATIETGAALPSKRIASIRELQDRELRTYGMICPSLPQESPSAYLEFSREAAAALRVEKMERVWAEVINLRGPSMRDTLDALHNDGFAREAELLNAVSGPGSRCRWDAYARSTFLAHRQVMGPEKLCFLQYVKGEIEAFWWNQHASGGAIPLGVDAHLKAPTN